MGLVDPRAAKAPARAHGEVDAKAMFLCKRRRHVPSLHPFRREKTPPLLFISILRAVYRYDVKAPKALLGELAALELKSRLVDGRPHPPVIHPRLHFLRRLRP